MQSRSTTLKLTGNRLDSKKAFLDAARSLQRKWNVEDFMKADNVTDQEPFAQHPGTQERQKANVNNFYDEICSMAGSTTVEAVRDSIEENTYQEVDLTTTTRKARQLLRYYSTLVQPNSVKDSYLTAKRNRHELHITDKSNFSLKEVIETYFNEFEEIEREMTQRTKMTEMTKLEHFTGMLSAKCNILTKALDDIDIHDETTTFAIFKDHVLKSAEKIGTRLRNEHRIQSQHHHKSSSSDTIMSSNSTTSTINSTTVTVDKALYDEMRGAHDRSQRQGRQSSYNYGEDRRSRSKSTESRHNQGSRARSPSNESRNSRSPKRGRTVAFKTDERPTSPYYSARSSSPHRSFSRK